MLKNYARIFDATYDEDLVNVTAKNNNGNLAIVFNVLGMDCDTMKNFTRVAKKNVHFIKSVRVKCEGKPEYVIK
ncbi:hypothetical protein RB195_011993 [Necator americanus]|uniref:Uncharacterized protein n=1 Tax=Necator americanus TaxID=51031 RepID=A0ABR1D503_NECAM